MNTISIPTKFLEMDKIKKKYRAEFLQKMDDHFQMDNF